MGRKDDLNYIVSKVLSMNDEQFHVFYLKFANSGTSKKKLSKMLKHNVQNLCEACQKKRENISF